MNIKFLNKNRTMENSRQKQVFHVLAHVPDIVVICPEFVLTIFWTFSFTNSGHHFFIGLNNIILNLINYILELIILYITQALILIH
jgi:hypothetical protein